MLSDHSQICLQWWSDALVAGLSCQSQSPNIPTIGVISGDGSGTGNSGTTNFISLDPPFTADVLDV